MTLAFIKTKSNTCFICDLQSNPTPALSNILFGKAVQLYCHRTFTPKNTSGTVEYSNYCTSAIQICHSTDVIDRRPANEAEINIFNRINNKQKLLKDQLEYLKANYYYEINATE